MSVFNRIAGTEEPKIPVWPLLTNFSRLIDAEITMQQLAELHELSQAEVIELQSYLVAISSLIEADKAELVRIGMAQPFVTDYAHARINVKVFPLMLRIEQGTITESQFRAKLGLS